MPRITVSEELQDRWEIKAKEKQVIADLSQRIFEVISNEHITVEKAEYVLDCAKSLVRTQTIAGN